MIVSPPLKIHRHADDGMVVLVLCGELDIFTTPAFSGTLMSTLDQPPQSLVLDISELEFVDSTGLRAILIARTLCWERSSGFAITAPMPSVKRLFEITGVLHLVPSWYARRPWPGPSVQLWPSPVPADGDGRLEEDLRAGESLEDLL